MFVTAPATVAVAMTIAITEMSSWPWRVVIVRQVDTTIVPWVAIRIEASRGFDGDQGRFRYVARTVLEEGAGRRLRAVLATV